MDLEPRLQRAFDRVELVGGSIGDPGEGRMCLMSLVAFLAGEPHSDAPGCASPVVQAFAVAVNDQMPRAARQRLKPFAPRIIGTNDGFDGVRAAILLQALDEGALSGASGRQPTERSTPAKGGRFAKLRRLWRWLREGEHHRLLHCARSGDDGVDLAREAARLIARAARRAPGDRERERHWDAAVVLLDRLCDVGAPAARRGPGTRTDRLARLENTPRPRRASSCEARRDTPAKMLGVRQTNAEAGVAPQAEPVFRPWRRIMSGTDDRANKAGPEAEPPAEDDAHTEGGAPTDRAHQDAGDGTLTGSVPAGLSLKQLREAANNDKTDDSGTS